MNEMPRLSLKDEKSFAEKIRELFDTSGSNPDSEQAEQGKGVSRRLFLKSAVLFSTANIFLGKPSLRLLEGVSAKQLDTDGKKEVEPGIPIAQTIIFDFAPTEATQGINQNEFTGMSEVWKTLELNGYPSLEEVLAAIPPKDPENKVSINDENQVSKYFYTNSEKLLEKYGEKFYAVVLFTYIINQNKTHGVEVAHALKRSQDFYGKNKAPHIYPSQGVFKKLNLRQFAEGNDSWSIHGLELSLSAEALIPFIQKAKVNSPSSHTVFKLSWELGSQEVVMSDLISMESKQIVRWSNAKNTGPNGEPLFFIFPDPERGVSDGQETVEDGKVSFVFDDGSTSLIALSRDKAEIEFDKLEAELERAVIDDTTINPVIGIEMREAYRKETVDKNFQEVVKVALAFPDDIFVLEAGNYKGDFRTLSNVPKNVIIVASWDGGSVKPSGHIYGADVYVNNKELRIGAGCLSSASFITATIEKMLIDKVPVEDIKERIQSVLSRDDSYRAREDETIINKLSQKSVAATLEAAHVISIDKVLKNMSFEF